MDLGSRHSGTTDAPQMICDMCFQFIYCILFVIFYLFSCMGASKSRPGSPLSLCSSCNAELSTAAIQSHDLSCVMFCLLDSHSMDVPFSYLCTVPHLVFMVFIGGSVDTVFSQ